MIRSIEDLLWVTKDVKTDSPEVCVGHAMSLVNHNRRFRTSSSGFTPRNTLSFMMNFIKNDEPGVKPLITITADNVPEHATTIYILKSEKDTYIFYQNPWGYQSDLRFTDQNDDNFVKTYKKEKWFKQISKIRKKELNIISNTPLGSRNKHKFSHEDRLIYSNKRLISYIKKFKPSLFSSLSKWVNYRNVIDLDVNDEICDNISEEHIMSILFLIRELFGKNHVHIIHPCDSMNLLGPQKEFRDGCKRTPGSVTEHMIKTSSVGACVVWEDIYSLNVNFLSKIAIEKEYTHSDILRMIISLPHNNLMGEKNANNLLGKVVFSTTPDVRLRDSMLILFNLIPDVEEVIVPDYYHDVNNIFDWHKKKVSSEQNDSELIHHLRTFLFLITSNSGIDQIMESFTSRIIDPDLFISVIPQIAMLLIDCKHGII